MSDIEIIKRAYLLLLQLDGVPRMELAGQSVLCDLRDRIAEATGKTGQEVQEAYEEDALLRRLGKRRPDAPIIALTP